MNRADPRIATLASSQHGLVARRQLRAAGVSDDQIRRRIDTGHLKRHVQGVFSIAGSPTTWQSELMAATLYGGPGAAVSHRAAAILHGLLRGNEIIEICTPRRRNARMIPTEWIVHTSIVFPVADLTTVAAIPCTTVERTLVDLGAVQPKRRVAHATDAALRLGKTDIALLTFVHARRRGRGRRGAGVLAEVLDDLNATGITESPYERDFLTLLVDADLPLPRLQYEIRDRGYLVGRVDFAWPERRVIVEIDGHEFHASRDQRLRDADRQNQLMALGYDVYRFTTDQIAVAKFDVVRTMAGVLRSCVE